MLAAMLIIHALGLVDDRKALGPFIKLLAQLAIAAILVIGFRMRVLTALDQLGLGSGPSIMARSSPRYGTISLTRA